MATALKSAGSMNLEAARGARVVIIEARYYDKIADDLAEGALAVLRAHACEVVRFDVPGALEIPQALGIIAEGDADFDGCVALGCVIRGETYHFEVVCDNANRSLMQTAIEYAMPVGNGILTVENEAQAIARASGGAAGKGGDAARACLRLIAIQREAGETSL